MCRNIYYLGHGSVVNINGFRVGGLSGIYNRHHFFRGLYERSGHLDDDTMRSCYHVRQWEVEKLKLLAPSVSKVSSATSFNPVDLFLSHDWPRGIEDYGDKEGLLRRKDRTGDMRQQFETGTFGNPSSMELLEKLVPKFWFAAHHHVKFAAVVPAGAGALKKTGVTGGVRDRVGALAGAAGTSSVGSYPEPVCCFK